MLNLLASFGPAKYVTIGLAGLTAVMGGMYLWTRVQIADLRTDLLAKQHEVSMLITELDTQKELNNLQRQGVAFLNDRINKEREDNAKLNARLKDIHNAPEDRNGPVSDILRDSISGLPDDEG